MDHNLDDSLNLESAIGVDFEQSEDRSTVVHEGDISLDTSGHEQNIPMEFEHIEEQPMLMDTGSEEMIDFMGDQFTLQEYEVPDGQVSNLTTTVEANNQMIGTTQAEGLVDMQFEPQTITVTASEASQAPTITTTEFVSVIKPAAPPLRAIAPKKETLVLTKASLPRQIAIAPKPPANIQKLKPVSLSVGKQLAIAPKPVALVANKSVLVKKMPEISKGSVLAQIGKQLVMVPASGSQKIKLVTAGTGVPSVRLLGTADADQTQLISQSLSGTQTKPLMAKVIVQGSGSGAVTKLVPAAAGGPAAARGPASAPRIAMQKKTVPISIGHNKVLVSSPTTSGIKFQKKQQLIAIKSPKAKLLPATTQGGTTTTKKVIISANQPQNVILKSSGQSKTGHVVKAVGPRTQVHQINVPGKGIQYIRLVTNPTPKAPAKPPVTAATPKTFYIADNKGALVRVAGDKPTTSQPPPLLVTSVSSSSKPSVKPQQKLVRIAPIPAKSAQTTLQQPRVGQSLLAPLSPMPMAEAQTNLINDMSELLQGDHVAVSEEVEQPEGKPDIDRLRALVEETQEEFIITEEPQDSKATLHALIADAVGSDADSQDGMDNSAMNHTVMEKTAMHNTVMENNLMNNSMMDNSSMNSSMMDNNSMDNSRLTNDYERRRSSMGDDSNSMDRSETRSDHPLIVVPSYMKSDMLPGEHADYGVSNHNMNNNMVTVELDPYNTYSAPNIQQVVDSDLVPGGMRPRRACNCTKSQCLKLYCDCFANGEFCNGCNCHNCHNNLENEELRQKAIRGCLDRNPNAFRPKIGKSKMGGPEIIRRHNKGCNCKRSGCLKNYCECYEAKIACSMICKCVGCRNVEETLERTRRREPGAGAEHHYPRLHPPPPAKQPCSFMTSEVIEAVCQCLLAAAVEADDTAAERDPTRDVIDEFARCLQDIISASHHAAPLTTLSEQQS